MKDNKLIAEFMGLPTEVFKPSAIINYYYKEHNSGTWYEEHELSYKVSWDWLMPVTEKISDIKGWSLNSTLEWLSESQDRDGLYDIEGIFQAVVEFINQINKEKL